MPFHEQIHLSIHVFARWSYLIPDTILNCKLVSIDTKAIFHENYILSVSLI